MAGKKILIVDDDETLNELIGHTLERSGYKTAAAFDGVSAISVARTEKPDLILLDMTLPKGRGEVVYTQFRQITDTKNIPILIITASSPLNDSPFYLSKGIVEEDFFVKPLDFNALLARIEYYLGSSAKGSSTKAD